MQQSSQSLLFAAKRHREASVRGTNLFPQPTTLGSTCAAVPSFCSTELKRFSSRFFFVLQVTMSLCLEGFGWSEEFVLPLPPPPPPSPLLSPLSAPTPGEEKGGELSFSGRPNKPKVESGADTDAEIAAAVGEGGAMMTNATSMKPPAPAPSLSAWAASQRQRWRKRLGRGRGRGAVGGRSEERQDQREAPAVSIVVEVGLNGAQHDPEAGLGRGGLLRVNAEVAFSACGRREVRVVVWCVVWCGVVVVCETLTVANHLPVCTMV